MAQRTTRAILAEWAADIGSIPSSSHDFVCDYCLGAVTSYRQCFGCRNVFLVAEAPRELRDLVVPMTSALSPSRWYSALSNYKRLQPELGAVIASVAHHFIASRASHIRAALGGDPDLISIVPSKRGITYANQALRRALSMVEPIASKLHQTLVHVPGTSVPRQGYNAGIFGPGPTAVSGQRVLLIEDAWVSGATAVSAAGALLAADAARVLITPVARVVEDGFWPEDHPYRIEMRKPWAPDDTSAWPRTLSRSPS